MAGNNGIAVTITAVDRASKTLDGLNRKITQANAPVVRLQKSFGQLAQSTGIRDTAREMKGLADSSARIFANMGRAGPAIAALGGLAGAAGLGAAMKQAADYGTGLQLTARRAGVGVGALQRIGNAAEISGGSFGGATESLGELNKNMQLLAHGGQANPQFMAAAQAMHINLRDANGKMRGTSSVMDEALHKLAKMHNAQQQLYFGNALLGSSFQTALFPAVTQGTRALDGFLDAGGRMVNLTPQQTQALQQSQGEMRRFGRDVESLVYGALGDWAPAVTKNLGALDQWIEQNRRTADSITKIGMAISGLMLVKPAAWVMRLLGLGAAVPVAAPLAAAAGAGIAAKVLADQAGYAPTGAPDILSGEELPTYTPIGPRRPGRPAAALSVPSMLRGAPGAYPFAPRGIRNNNPLNLSYVPGQGAIGTDGRFGVYKTMQEGIAANARQLLRYQDRDKLTTLRGIIGKWAPPGTNDTEKYVDTVAKWMHVRPAEPINLHNPATMLALVDAMSRYENGRSPGSRDEMAGINTALNPKAELAMPQKQEAATTIKGGANLHIRLDGMPPGTRVSSDTYGNVFSGAPHVVMPMPYGGGPAS